MINHPLIHLGMVGIPTIYGDDWGMFIYVFALPISNAFDLAKHSALAGFRTELRMDWENMDDYDVH